MGTHWHLHCVFLCVRVCARERQDNVYNNVELCCDREFTESYPNYQFSDCMCVSVYKPTFLSDSLWSRAFFILLNPIFRHASFLSLPATKTHATVKTKHRTALF